ncbi:sporulation protein YqfD [Lachnospiraceae bacterium OttesenSCG-928-D06]|nr:sporulation protein YqfD [Lachnospiraceae bacterium OttesenSCG-928-D06]
MIGLLKFLKGYLRVKVWGFSPERFMNLCSNKNILLWNIVKEGDVYFMNISLLGFYQLKPLLKKTGTRVSILERTGLPFLIPVILSRKIFILGLLLCVSFWIWSGNYLWTIEITGNYQITEDMLNTFLSENQVVIGTNKKELDLEMLEKIIRQNFPEITWISTKISGTKLEIALKENDALSISPVLNEESSGKDLVAEYDGVITSMIVRSGVPLVSIGDIIEKGTILVEGKVPIYNDDATIREYQYVTADADIYMEYILPYEDSLPYDYIKKEYTGRESSRYFLRFGNKEIKIMVESPYLVYDCVIKENKPTIFEKLSVPVFGGSYTYREYQNVEYIYSTSEVNEIMSEKINAFMENLSEKGVQIIEKNVKIESKGDLWVVSGSFLVNERIGLLMDTERIEIPAVGPLDESN